MMISLDIMATSLAAAGEAKDLKKSGWRKPSTLH